jgi:Tetratricopeptide repeat
VPKILRWVLGGAAVLLGLGLLVVFASMAFVFSIGTAVITVKVDASVYDRDTGKPVPNCLLAFEKSETSGYGRTSLRTDASGRSSHETSHSYVGSMFWPFSRDRHPKLRVYLGEPPRYGTFTEVETWDVQLHFREPWRKRDAVPRVEVQRAMTHETVLDPPPGKAWQQAGSNPLRTDPPQTLVGAVVRFEPDSRGGELYRIPLSLFLDQGQIAACRAEPPVEVERRANTLFNDKKYEDALKEYREAAQRVPEAAWAHQGIGDCLLNLDRGKEAIASYRTAAQLAPADPDVQFAYGNSLREGRYEEAVAQLKKVTALEPGKARGFIGLGSSLYALDRCREAVVAYDKATQLCPTCLDDGDRREYAECRQEIGRR